MGQAELNRQEEGRQVSVVWGKGPVAVEGKQPVADPGKGLVVVSGKEPGVEWGKLTVVSGKLPVEWDRLAYPSLQENINIIIALF